MIWLRCGTLSTHTCVLSTISLSRAAHCRLNSSLSYSSSGCCVQRFQLARRSKAPRWFCRPTPPSRCWRSAPAQAPFFSSSSAMARASLPRLVSKISPGFSTRQWRGLFRLWPCRPQRSGPWPWPPALCPGWPRRAPKRPAGILGAIFSARRGSTPSGCCTATRRFAPTLASLPVARHGGSSGARRRFGGFGAALAVNVPHQRFKIVLALAPQQVVDALLAHSRRFPVRASCTASSCRLTGCTTRNQRPPSPSCAQKTCQRRRPPPAGCWRPSPAPWSVPAFLMPLSPACPAAGCRCGGKVVAAA